MTDPGSPEPSTTTPLTRETVSAPPKEREDAREGRLFTVVYGRCPACGSSSLFVGAGGHVTCSLSDCSNPAAADDMLRNPHLLTATEDALRERNARLGRIEQLARGERA